MTERSLPSWMSNDTRRLKEKQSSSSGSRNLLENQLPLLQFGGSVTYSKERHDCSFLSEDLRSGLPEGSAVVGFDLEWPPSFSSENKKKVALVQLCVSEEKCFLFHISCMSGFPPGLKLLLEDERVLKVGVGVNGDKWKLLSDYDVRLKSAVELSELANETLSVCERWSLDALVKHLLKKRLLKERELRCGRWDEFILTEQQIKYAATDAYAGLLIYQKLQEIRMSGEMLLFQEDDDDVCVLLSGSSGFSSLKQRVCELADEMKELVHGASGNLVSLSSAEMLVEDLSHTITRLRRVMTNSTPEEPRPWSVMTKSTPDKPCLQRVMTSSSPEEPCPDSLQRTEILEEDECVSEFLQNSGYSEEDLDEEMMKCADHLEGISEGPGPEENLSDEDVLGSDVPQPGPEHVQCLKTYFGHHSFKPVQWKVIHSVLKEKRDNLVVMATGYGKSLCFQFPAVFSQKVSVVVSPLIALMEDQVLQLQMSNIPACFVGSAQSRNLSEEMLRGDFRVVYMTPEFCSKNLPLLVQLHKSIGVCLLAVDEAHCISQWGHDFRSSYRDLWKLKKHLSDVPLLALTATASPSIRDDIIRSLRVARPLITCTSFDRPNLYLDVSRKSTDLMLDLKRFLVKKEQGKYEFQGSAIVYCPSKKEAERVWAGLCKLGVACQLYHAGLSIGQRRETQQRFMRDDIQCVVATVAFGMGINKSDVRKVIHYGAPKEMESYYQELGRAGRDGLPSACHVLWQPGDMALNRFLLTQCKNEKLREHRVKMMSKMEKYLNSSECRRKLILSHFEDKRVRKMTAGILGSSECCNNCRTGVRSQQAVKLQDFGSWSYQLLSAISVMNEKFGITAPVLFLRGSGSQRVPDHFRTHSLFGVGRKLSDGWWKALARELISEGFLTETSGQSSFITLCKLTAKGRQWLGEAADESHRRLCLQPNTDLFSPLCVTRPGSLLTHKPSAHSRSKAIAEAQSLSEQNRHTSQRSSCDVTPAGAADVQLQAQLYSSLLQERQKLSRLRDVPPALLATNKILLDMSKIRPCSVSSLKHLDGVSEAKADMLSPLISVVLSFCQTHGLKDEVSPVVHSSSSMTMSETVSITNTLNHQQKKATEKAENSESHEEVQSNAMDAREDELFLQVLLPQEDNSQKSCDTIPQNTGMNLASWNQQNLDDDTQELFSDSPVKSLPVKRKLPDWSGATNSSSASVSEKNRRKKKGLFS